MKKKQGNALTKFLEAVKENEIKKGKPSVSRLTQGVVETEVVACVGCPLYDGSARNDPAVCTHPDAPKGAYENTVPRSHFKLEPIPEWCPLRDRPYTEEKIINGKRFAPKYIKLKK